MISISKDTVIDPAAGYSSRSELRWKRAWQVRHSGSNVSSDERRSPIPVDALQNHTYDTKAVLNVKRMPRDKDNKDNGISPN